MLRNCRSGRLSFTADHTGAITRPDLALIFDPGRLHALGLTYTDIGRGSSPQPQVPVATAAGDGMPA